MLGGGKDKSKRSSRDWKRFRSAKTDRGSLDQGSLETKTDFSGILGGPMKRISALWNSFFDFIESPRFDRVLDLLFVFLAVTVGSMLIFLGL